LSILPLVLGKSCRRGGGLFDELGQPFGFSLTDKKFSFYPMSGGAYAKGKGPASIYIKTIF